MDGYFFSSDARGKGAPSYFPPINLIDLFMALALLLQREEVKFGEMIYSIVRSELFQSKS